MGKTDKDRPWGVMMSDMTVNIHREIWHTHYFFDHEIGQHRWVECDFDPRNNVINFQHDHGHYRWRHTPVRHCELTRAGWPRWCEKVRKDDRKRLRRMERANLRTQLRDALREGIDTDPDIYTT